MKNRIMLIAVLWFIGTLVFGQKKDTSVVKLRGSQLIHPLANEGYPNLKQLIVPGASSDSVQSSTSKSSSSCEGAEEVMKKRKIKNR